MRVFLISVCLLVVFGSAKAEEGSYFIKGTVADSMSGSAVELATISLTRNSDAKVVSVTTAGADGKFSMSRIESGDYVLTINFVGYESKKIPVQVTTADVDLGTVQLSSSVKALEGATIVSQKSLITKTAEKTVFNVAQSPINQSGNGEDVLRNMPGVIIDQRGNVSIAGKDGVRVLVDGKPDALASSNLQNFLKSLPANSIEAIELITNPSAKYDAAGNAGIINIKLKKGRNEGWNGSITVGAGYIPRFVSGGTLNYRKKKINVFALYGLDMLTNRNRYIENRRMTGVDTSYYSLDSKGKEMHINSSIKGGIDYFINDKNTLTFKVGGTPGGMKWYSDALGKSMDANKNLTNSFHSINDDRLRFSSISGGVDYQRKFDSAGHEFTAAINYSYLYGGNHATLESLGYDSNGNFSDASTLHQRTVSDFKIHNVTAQLDYALPIPKLTGYKIELGAKNEATRNASGFDVFRTANTLEYKDTLLSNQFEYTENISAAYFMFNGAVKKFFSYTGGLRAEHTYMYSNNKSVNRNYLSFFPSASLNFTLSEASSISTSYSRRVQRPQFRQISNTVTYIDQYTTWQGNPAIQPSFSDLVSVNYTLMVKQHMFSFDATGSLQRNDFTEVSRLDSGGITRGGFYNGANSQILNFTFYTKLQLTKWWDLQMNHQYTYSNYSFKSGVNTKPFSGSAYNLWASTSFKFWKNTVLEMNGFMNTGGVNSQGSNKPVGVLNASVKKSFFKDRFTVAIVARNIFNSMKWRWTVYNTNLDLDGSWKNIDRHVQLNLTYRFGSGKAPQRKMVENERLGGGGGGR